MDVSGAGLYYFGGCMLLSDCYAPVWVCNFRLTLVHPLAVLILARFDVRSG